MTEYFDGFLKDLGFYLTIVKFILYFSVGAILLVFINKILRAFTFIFSKLSKEKLIDRLNFIFKLIIFMLVSTATGWLVIYLIF